MQPPILSSSSAQEFRVFLPISFGDVEFVPLLTERVMPRYGATKTIYAKCPSDPV